MGAAEPGIRSPIYLAGAFLGRGPARIQPKPGWAETRQRLASGTLQVDRWRPVANASVRHHRLLCDLSWETLTQADILALNSLVGWGGPFDFCPFWQDVEWFQVAAGAARAGTLARRSAPTTLSSLPPSYATTYALWADSGPDVATIVADAGTPLTLTLGAPDAYGLTPWTASGTPAAAELVRVVYYPLYHVHVGENQPKFDTPHRQGQTLSLEEV